MTTNGNYGHAPAGRREPRSLARAGRTSEVLVAYCTSGKQEPAHELAQELRRAGITVELLPAKQVATIDGYQAVILSKGSALGNWPDEAKQFVQHHQVQGSSRPVWLFSSGRADAAKAAEPAWCLRPNKAARRLLVRIPRGILGGLAGLQAWAASVAQALTEPQAGQRWGTAA